MVIENFKTDKECDELMERSSYLIEHNNLNNDFKYKQIGTYLIKTSAGIKIEVNEKKNK